MKKDPLVSVLMPAFNSEKSIGESINSILKQSFGDFELIILDDASTDDTYTISEKYQKKDKRVRVLKNSFNQNIATSRNTLVSEARGKYVAWQDSDDVSVKDRLEKQVFFLENNPEVGLVGGNLEFFDEVGAQNIRRYAQDDKNLRKMIFRYSPVAQPTAMVRMEALRYAGEYGKDLSPAEDIDMSFRIGTKFKFANLDQTTLKYRNYCLSSTYKSLIKIELLTIRTRLKYMFHKSYRFSFIDLVYNGLQFLSIFLLPLPARLRIKLFNFFRNS